MPSAITRLNPPQLPDTQPLGYSQISIVAPGRMAYVSGQVGTRADGSVPEDLPEQAQLVVARARAALQALGATPQDIVIARCFVTDLNETRMQQAWPVIVTLFKDARPSVTGVGVAALADPALQIELELTVRLPD